MALHNDLGVEGENYAVRYLQNQGFTILYRNWRYLHKEIDVVAMEGSTLVFVEVKTRTGKVEVRDTMSYSKMNYLLNAANAFININNRTEEARFDVVMVRYIKGEYQIEHIREAFR